MSITGQSNFAVSMLASLTAPSSITDQVCSQLDDSGNRQEIANVLQAQTDAEIAQNLRAAWHGDGEPETHHLVRAVALYRERFVAETGAGACLA